MSTTADRRPRRRALASLLVGILVATGCADTQEEPLRPTSTDGGPSEPAQDVPRPSVTFDVEVSPGSDAIAVSWSLTNTGDAPIMVVDRVPRASGASVAYDPEAAYVVGGDDGAVQVAQRLYDLPETDRMTWARLPRAGATELAPDAVLRRDLAVGIPLRRSSPWGDDIGHGPVELPDPVTSVQFCLGVVAGEPEPSWGLDRTDGEVLLNHGGGAVAAQHVLCSDPIPLD